MPVLSAILLVVSLVFAVVIGPQARLWTWGPALFALGLATLAAIPVFWKRGKSMADLGIVGWGLLSLLWFGWRAWHSPVAELGQADLLLIGGSVGALICIRAIAGNASAERVLIWGIALLLLANLLVIAQQLATPGFTPVFRSRGMAMPSGFFTHYNEAANYLIASSLLVAAAALFGRHTTITRVLWLLLAIAGLAGVWFTRSRGGILAAAVACGVFAVVALILGKQRNTRWFAPAMIAIPVIGLAIGIFLFMGWQSAQATRHPGTGIDQLLDNDCRLYFLGIALSCIGLHPWTGGGSRSFSWECFRFMDGKANGDLITHKPEMVHNEWVQAATDYGLIGASLLAGLIGALVLAAILRALFEKSPDNDDSCAAWRLGALAGLAGMLVQSCFSFVFHMIPGALLLGICLGQLSRCRERAPCRKSLTTRIGLTLTAVACVLLLLPAGWTGSRVTRLLWPSYFSRQAAISDESRIDALGDAIQLMPLASFYQERGGLFQQMAGANTSPSFREPAERAIDDYQQAARLHRYDPRSAVNRANLLSLMQRDAEAEADFARAIVLQGGMEPGFRSHFSLASHYLRKGLRQFQGADPQPAHATLELAAAAMERAVQQMHWPLQDMLEARVAIQENLGAAREAVGDRDGALQAYNLASSLPTGTRAHYLAGWLLGKMARDAYEQRRPAQALSGFLAARKRLLQAGAALPPGVTSSQRTVYLAYLDQSIAFLQGAKIQPLK